MIYFGIIVKILFNLSYIKYFVYYFVFFKFQGFFFDKFWNKLFLKLSIIRIFDYYYYFCINIKRINFIQIYVGNSFNSWIIFFR